MEHKPCVGEQLALFAIAPTFETRATVHDPYWDEIVAPEQTHADRWNPSDFGEVPHKLDDRGQLSIFYDESHEPPDPDDYQNLDEYHQAWGQWQILVREQVSIDTAKTAPEHNTHWIERYWVERCTNKYWYYRYCWMEGRKTKRCHLGPVRSQLAKQKKANIEVWIADGYSATEIQKLMRDS